MGKSRQKKSEKTRQFIIEKAAPIFNMKGFYGTSLQDITEITGLTKGSIYGNFTDKEELAIAAFEYNSNQILHHIKPLVLSDASAPDKILAITGFYRKYLYDPVLSGGCPFLNTAAESDDTHPALRDITIRDFDYIRRSFVYIIDQGINNGEFMQHVDKEHYATIFLALIEGGIMQTKLYNKSKYLLDCLVHIEMMIADIRF
jgi:AcrR family transcriptional regulator